jgi:hypothetical protein
MAKDFRADQLRTKAIIGTGSILSSRPHLGLMFYSSSKAQDWAGSYASSVISNVGNDVWLLFDGVGNTGLTRADGSSVLFKGDVVVSGTLWAERSVIEVSDTVVGDFRVPNKIIQGYTTDPTTGKALFLADPTTSNNGSSNGAGNISFKIVDGVAGAFAYPDDGSTNTDVFFHVSGSRGVKGTDDRGLALFDGDVFISGNFELSPESAFSLAGDFTIGGDLTVGGNDILGSAGNALSFGAVDPDVTITRGLKIGNDALTGSDGTVFLFHSGSGDFVSPGDVAFPRNIQVVGNVIENSAKVTALQFHPTDNRTIMHVLNISGSDPGDPGSLRLYGNHNWGEIVFKRQGSVSSAGDYLGILAFTGQTESVGTKEGAYIVTSPVEDWTAGPPVRTKTKMEFLLVDDGSPNVTDDVRFRIDEDRITVSGSLKIHGGADVSNATIKDRNDNNALYFPGDGNVTFPGNATVVGNLNVSGSVTAIGTDNLRVEDALILLASGSTTNSTKGGIAIASGSTIDDNALVFGTAAGTGAPGAFRAGYMDVQDGTVTNMDSATPVDIQLAGIRFKNRTNSSFTNTYVTASVDGTRQHLILRATDGRIDLQSTSNIGIYSEQHIILDVDTLSNSQIYDEAPDLVLQHKDGGVSSPGSVQLRGGSSGTAKLTFRSNSNYIYADAVVGGLHVSGSRHVTIGSTQSGGESGLVLSASSEELVGGPVLVMSASDQFNGATREGYISIGSALSEIPALFTSTRHRDVRTLLSGTVGTAGSTTRGVTLVSGDLVVSGNTDFKGAVAIGSISSDNLTLASVSSNEPYLRFRDSTVQINRRTGDDALVFLDGDLGAAKSLRDLTSLSVVDNTDVFTISGGEPSYIKTTGSFSFDSDNQYTTAVNGGNSDIYFYVSGSIGSAVKSYRPASNLDRGTAVFGGDVHVSGSIFTDNPQFYMTLHTAYNTPGYGYPVPFSGLMAGAGAVIDTDGSGIPVQVRGANAGNEHLLALTGSMAFAYPGSGDNVKIEMKTDNRLEFHNSAGEVFRMTGASGGQAVWFTGNNRIYFEDTSRYVYGVTQDSVKKLKLENTDSGGTVAVSTNSGRMEVTGSLYPGADNTYDLGSNDYRWANIYTGDLHLQNERGDWTVIEEEDFLTLRNNKNGKRYKLLMELMDEE